MTEMAKLKAALEKMGVEHSYKRHFDGGEQIVVTTAGEYEWDAICTPHSYGGTEGLLEVMGKALIGNDVDVRGHLTAEDVLEMMKGRMQG